MKQTNIRAQRNAGKNAHSPQVASSPENAPGQTRTPLSNTPPASATRRELWDALGELDRANNQADALLLLLVHHVTNPSDGGRYCGSIEAGLVELHTVTAHRLHEKYKQLHAIARNVA